MLGTEPIEKDIVGSCVTI